MSLSIENILIELVVQIIAWVIFVVPALWISGRLIAGKENAKFTDALWIVILGTVIYYFVSVFIEQFFAAIFGVWSFIPSLIVLLLIWLALVKHFFDCGWLKALAISIVTVIIAFIILLIVGFILALIGFSAGWFPTPFMIL